MNPDDQPSTPSKPAGASRPGATGMWQAPSVEQMQEMLPQYEILEILGRGGMGAVYKGRQKSLKRLVAIKILPPDAADDEMRFVERFENEAQTMAAMNHPAIVAVYDFGETAEGLLYFIMEYVDGTDVHKMIQSSGKLGEDYALAITAHVCDALDYAHSRGVIHRDIKPANILIDQEGRVKVADFGLAKVHDPSMTSGLTRTNMAMGTPDYVAPEALSMGMVVDHRADLYAIGVMLYQMLTGEVPRGMFRMPSEKGLGSDPRFDEIICKAMEQDRDHRYQTAGEVRRSLDEILTTPQPKNDGTGIVPVEEIPKKVVLNIPGGSLDRSAGTPAGGAPARSQGPPPKKVPGKKIAPPKKQSSATSTWLGIGGIAALLVVSGVVWIKGNPTPLSEAPTGVSQTEALFDGLTFSGWRTTNGTAPEASWRVEAGGLTSSKISVLRTVEEFGDCEFDFEWRVGAGGNGGVFYHVLGDHLAAPELQLCDPANSGKTPSGGLFGVVQPLSDASKPIGEWNTGRLVVRGSLSEHWINGQKVCTYDNASADFSSKLAASKFAGKPQFGPGSRGALAIQSNGGEVAYRNLRIQRSNAKPAVKTVPDVLWTDWLTPKLAKGQFKKSGYVVEKDGITTDQNIIGIDLAEDKVAQGGIRLTYLLRDAQGAQIVFRNRATQEMYVADDSGSELSIARVGEGNKKTMLVSEQSPATLSRTGERTLEFRVTGGSLKATVNGTFSVSAQEPTLATDPGSFGAFSIRKGLLLKKVEIADGKETVGGATTVAKLNEDFIRAVAAASPEEQVSLVSAKLNEINGAHANLVPTIMGGKVKYLRVERKGDALLPDISPLAALKDLTDLRVFYVGPADISCLAGLPLERLELHGGTFEDISVLKSMPLRFLGLRTLSPNSQEALDFTILRGMKLEMLHLSSKPLVDISFIKGMPLKDLNLTGSGVRDFSPITGMPLNNLEFDPEAKPDMALLRSIPTLKTINKRPAAEYLKTPDGATATWTDWLTPKLASGTFDGGQWKREAGGFTTDQSLAGYEVLPAVTRDGAMRVTFAMRGSEGVMINVRDTKVGNGSHQYTAQYTGTSLYLAHASSRLITEPMPAELRDRPEHTLEFRFEGENLIAILNDTHRISARHSQLTEGRCAVVLTKGVLVKKIEVQTIQPPR